MSFNTPPHRRAFALRGQAISHVLRLTEPHERLALLNITISTLPSMYVRGFKRTATNIVDYYEAMGDDCADPDLRAMVSSQAVDTFRQKHSPKTCTCINFWYLSTVPIFLANT